MKLTRGISSEFAQAFKQCELFELYQKNKHELFIGVRNNYLNLYYNSDSIAKVRYSRGKITCEIDRFYLEGIHHTGKDKIKKTDPFEIYEKYRTIKKNSETKSTDEKKAQSQLILLNNRNDDSNWFCFDIEWVKALNIQKLENEEETAKFNARFDIIAISKNKPYKVALIELKYGSGAIGGNSGISKHIHDFKTYKENHYFDKQEIIDIIESQQMLGVHIPDELKNMQIQDIEGFEFYVITLDNAKQGNGSTPKQSMAGYLFNQKRWESKKLSKKRVESEHGDVTNRNNAIHVNFLFSTQTLDTLTINDVINHPDYERE